MKPKLCDRLRIARENCKMTQRDIERVTGIPAGTYSTYERGVRDVNSDIIVKLAKCFGTTTDYLYGIENVSDNELSQKEIENIKKYRKLDDYGTKAVDDLINNEYERCINDADNAKPKIITFKRFNINKASAGCGYDLSNSDEWAEIKVVDTPEAREADFAVEIDGNSMAPTFHDGDIVYVVVDNDVQVGEIGLFRQNGNGFIKERGEHYLISHNEKYPNIYPEDGEISCVGRVIGIAEIPE